MTKAGNQVKAFFFDLDGTLCDTDKANYLAYKKSFEKEGYQFTKSDFNKVNGHRADLFIPMLIKNISKSKVQLIREHKAEYYPELLHLAKPNKSLINFLESMKKSHKMVLVTTARRQNAIHILKKSNLDKSFDYMIFGDDIKNPKPKPDVYLKALKITKLKPSQVIVFEDSEVGIAAAKKAGLTVIKVEMQ